MNGMHRLSGMLILVTARHSHWPPWTCGWQALDSGYAAALSRLFKRIEPLLTDVGRHQSLSTQSVNTRRIGQDRGVRQN